MQLICIGKNYINGKFLVYDYTPTVTQYENFSDIEDRNTNYNHLMLDMEKKWLFQNQRLQLN